MRLLFVFGGDEPEQLHAVSQLVHHGELVVANVHARCAVELTGTLTLGSDEGEQREIAVEQLKIVERVVGYINETDLVDRDVLGPGEVAVTPAPGAELVQILSLLVEDLDPRVDLIDDVQLAIPAEVKVRDVGQANSPSPSPCLPKEKASVAVATSNTTMRWALESATYSRVPSGDSAASVGLKSSLCCP